MNQVAVYKYTSMFYFCFGTVGEGAVEPSRGEAVVKAARESGQSGRVHGVSGDVAGRVSSG